MCRAVGFWPCTYDCHWSDSGTACDSELSRPGGFGWGVDGERGHLWSHTVDAEAAFTLFCLPQLTVGPHLFLRGSPPAASSLGEEEHFASRSPAWPQFSGQGSGGAEGWMTPLAVWTEAPLPWTSHMGNGAAWSDTMHAGCHTDRAGCGRGPGSPVSVCPVLLE